MTQAHFSFVDNGLASFCDFSSDPKFLYPPKQRVLDKSGNS